MPQWPCTIYISGNGVKGRTWLKRGAEIFFFFFRCKQTFIALGSSGVHFPHRIICNTVALHEMAGCCAVVRAQRLSSPPSKSTTCVDFTFLTLNFLSPSVSDLFPRTGMLLSHSGKCWLDLPWQPDRQSNNNRGNCTRNISKSQPSYLLLSISFWYKTRLLWVFFFFATVLKQFKKQKATSSTWFRIVNHNQH